MLFLFAGAFVDVPPLHPLRSQHVKKYKRSCDLSDLISRTSVQLVFASKHQCFISLVVVSLINSS